MRRTLVLGFASVGLAVVGALLIGLNPAIAAALAIVILLCSIASLACYRTRADRQAGASSTAVFMNFALVATAVLLLIQLVPYGREHGNPAITGEPQ